MSRVYVGNLDPTATERDLEDEFNRFGKVAYIWVAKKPPGFAFVDYEDPRDADDAVRKMDGFQGWRVEVSKKSFGARAPVGGAPGRGMGGGGRDMACYNCGEMGHLARDCRARGVPPMRGARGYSPPRRSYGRSRSPRRSLSPPPRRRRSLTPDSRSPPPRRRRSPTPLDSPVRRSRSRSPVAARARSPSR